MVFRILESVEDLIQIKTVEVVYMIMRSDLSSICTIWFDWTVHRRRRRIE